MNFGTRPRCGAFVWASPNRGVSCFAVAARRVSPGELCFTIRSSAVARGSGWFFDFSLTGPALSV
jgi:hypothetical protein